MIRVFGELNPGEIAPWLNLGALGILGYHLLWGLPRMVKEFSETIMAVAKIHGDNSDKDRAEFLKRNDKVADAVLRMAEALTNNCKYISYPHDVRIKLADNDHDKNKG